MAEGPGKLHGITKPDGNHVSNSFETIEGSIVYLEFQIGDQQTNLDL